MNFFIKRRKSDKTFEEFYILRLRYKVKLQAKNEWRSSIPSGSKLLRKHNLAADNREGGKIPRKLQTQTKGMFYI